jgi:hypothetical protein
MDNEIDPSFVGMTKKLLIISCHFIGTAFCVTPTCHPDEGGISLFAILKKMPNHIIRLIKYNTSILILFFNLAMFISS